MKKQIIDIPHFKTLFLSNIVLDFNGTLAKDGILLPDVKELLKKLSEKYNLYVITADTFGTVHSQFDGSDVTIKVLESGDHTAEKSDFINELGAESCVAFGNGNNDAKMLKTAALGIVIMGKEGCSVQALQNSDITCGSIIDALNLLLNEKRLIATLRR